MIQLTRAEEQIMQVLWTLQETTVQDIRERFDDPKPARTTIASVLNILENKGFATHKSFGRVNVYYPVVAKNEYSKTQLFGMIKNYFNNSLPAMVSFFAKEKNLSVEELDELLEETKKELMQEEKRKQS
ncbi:MAG: BlaI/MecI/CopY family transcriptional regulator [Candidatus Azobacteroides sp.]|nr:BlaI/MecI/CopY family transcriptional regulator [Candidatus Azobacteroides sp.]